MSLLLSQPVKAADSVVRQEGISLNAGQSQVIENLDPNSKPAIHVVQNPYALVVHNDDPTKLVLLGAEAGKWDISVKLKDGEDVTYNISVSAIQNWSAPLKPGVAPAAMTDGGLGSTSVASAASMPTAPTALDSGAGPVANPTTETVTPRSAPAPGADTHSRLIPGTGDDLAVIDPTDPVRMGEAAPVPSGPSGSSVIPSQNVSAAIMQKGKFTSDPSIVSSGDSYSTDGVASSGGSHFLPADGISMMIGTSQVIDFPSRMRRVSIADTSIADVQVINPYELNLIGHKPGFTTLTVWTGQGHYEERQIRISPDGKQQVLLNCIVAELNRGEVENQGTNFTVALQKAGFSLFGIPGAVGTPYSGSTNLIPTTLLPNGTTIAATGQMPTGGALIPLLLSQGATYGISAQNSNIAANALFQYLENHNMAKILAQPRLLANTGEKAKFLSGGEIPIVVAQALNTSIVFKEFGTKVVFEPTVVGVNEVELLVQPEVSEPDYAHGVELFGFQVPAFVTRRAETLVRLHDDQTLIIAGLILHEKKEIIQKVPYIGDVPYLGGLFRNTDWEDTETDLVMSVTPEIVHPLPSGAQVYLPTSRPPMTAEEIKTEPLTTPNAARPRF
jgi:pilus assembly protein CpaC